MLKYKLQYRRQGILYSLSLYLIIRVGFLFIVNGQFIIVIVPRVKFYPNLSAF